MTLIRHFSLRFNRAEFSFSRQTSKLSVASATSSMDLPPSWFETCTCGRIFNLPQAYSYHRNTCRVSKKRFADDLQKAKDALQSRKRRKLEQRAAMVNEELGPQTHLGSISTLSSHSTSSGDDHPSQTLVRLSLACLRSTRNLPC